VGPRSTTRGSFNVYLDGVKVTSTAVSEKASTVSYRRVLYARTMPSGTHTIEVRAVGNGRIDIDAILVLTTP
jgi:subtilase family serine protease